MLLADSFPLREEENVSLILHNVNIDMAAENLVGWQGNRFIQFEDLIDWRGLMHIWWLYSRGKLGLFW